MPRLSPDDHRLLDEMNQRDGIARISDGRPRHGAERLVEAGLATSRALNVSDVEYEMRAARDDSFADQLQHATDRARRFATSDV